MRRIRSDALDGLIPTVSVPVVFIRQNATDFIVRTPLVGGGSRDYTEYFIKIKPISTTLLNLAGISTYENGVIRVQSYYPVHLAVFEYAFGAGLTTDPIGSFNFYGNDHGNIVSTGLTIKMDGGADLSAMANGVTVKGSSLVVLQNFTIKLPSNPTLNYGTLVDSHTFDVNGCTVQHDHTPTIANAANQSSYSAMFPFTGLNRGQFGSGTVLDVTPDGSGSTSADQGQQSTFKGWHTDRPDLFAECILVNGNPGTPDLWSNDTTTFTYVKLNSGYSKAYIAYRSGTSPLAAVTSSHKTLYRMRK